ncbi:MAG: T9SS type A sorting domain-containing protein [Candidatus Krumholzibacteriia bacterium]
MRRTTLPLSLFLALWLLVLPAAAGDLTFCTLNALNFPGSTGAERAPDFRTALAALGPDLLVVQELIGYPGRDDFLANILDEMEPDGWQVAAFHDGYDTDRGLFYRTGTVTVLNSGWLDTDLRDIDWWHLQEAETGLEFRVFTLHLKASQGSTEEQRRLEEVTVLRTFLAGLPAELPVIVAGDFNIYTSTEPAYQHLMAAGAGRLYDPIDSPGNWHNNADFAAIHTQSPRTLQFGGGATGGMDDRFDQILVSDVWLDGSGVELLTDTYTAFGNDGLHFNQVIIDGDNAAVSAAVAQAIHDATDHLPVFAVLRFPEPDPVPARPVVTMRAWPNPFNPTASVQVEAADTVVTDLCVYDLTGRLVAEIWRSRTVSGVVTTNWQPTDLPSGVYLARLTVDGRPLAVQKLVLAR